MDQTLEIGQVVKINRSLTVGDLYVGAVHNRAGGGHSQADQVVIRAGEIGRIVSPLVTEDRHGEKLDRPWYAVRFFFTLPDHYRRDPTAEPVHYLRAEVLEAVTLSEAVILTMIGRYGKPWRNTGKDQAVIAEFLEAGDPSVLHNWRHAAGSMLEIAERLRVGAWGKAAAAETDLAEYMEAGDLDLELAKQAADPLGPGDGVSGLYVPAGGPFVCEGCKKLIRYVTISGRAICEACLDAEAEAVTLITARDEDGRHFTTEPIKAWQEWTRGDLILTEGDRVYLEKWIEANPEAIRAAGYVLPDEWGK